MRVVEPRAVKAPLEPLDEPGAECIQPFQSAKVDVDQAGVS